MTQQIRFRRDSAAAWASANPILGSGEPGYAVDTTVFKVGNGITAWRQLPTIVDFAAIIAAQNEVQDDAEQIAGYVGDASQQLAAATSLIAAIAQIPSSGLSLTANSRTAMAALPTDRPVILSEAGHESVWVYDTSGLSAKVAADPGHNTYMPPNPTTGFAGDGSQGAWVRKFGAGGTVYVTSLADAKALTGMVAGQLVYVGGDAFVVVSDGALGANGITTFFFDENLSAETSETVAEASFSGHSYTSNPGVALAHDAIDLASIKVVLTNGGEEMPGLYMHGHSISPNRTMYPQDPGFDLDAGKIFDPSGALRAASTRTTGPLIKYKYNTSTLVLKRVHKSRWESAWVPAGTDRERYNWLCWLFNFMAAEGAKELRFSDLPPFIGPVEVPDGVKLSGTDYRTCGLKVPNGKLFDAWLLSRSSVPGDPATFPITSPNNQTDAYLNSKSGYAPAVFPATNSSGFSIENVRIDLNLRDNMQPWTSPALYAMGHMGASYWFRDTPVCGGICATNHGGRVIPPGFEIHAYGDNFVGNAAAACLLGHTNAWFYNHGRLILGDTLGNHWLYLFNLTGGNIEVQGCTAGDGLRVYHLDCDTIRFRPQRHPPEIFTSDPLIVAGMDQTSLLQQPYNLIAYAGDTWPPNLDTPFQTAGFTQPPYKLAVKSIEVDAMAMEETGGLADQGVSKPFVFAGDNVHIGQIKVRGGTNFNFSNFINQQGNGSQYGPYKNWTVENVSLEIANRRANGLQFFTANNPSSSLLNGVIRNVTVVYLNSAGSMPEVAAPDGTNPLLGIFRFDLPDDSFAEGAKDLSFTGRVGSDMAGLYFTLDGSHATAPTATIWYSVGGVGSAPAGANPIQVDVASGATATAIATATRVAIVGNNTINTWYSALDAGAVLTVGILKGYRVEGKSVLLITPNVLTGVTATARKNRRYYDPHRIIIEGFNAPSANALSLMTIASFAAGHGQVSYRIKDSVFGAWEQSSILNGSNAGQLSAWTADMIAGVSGVFTDCMLTYADGRQGVSITPQNMEPLLYLFRHRNSRFDRGNGSFYHSDRAGEFTFTSTGAETSFDMSSLALISVPLDFQLTPVDANARSILGAATQEWRTSGGAAITPTTYGYKLAINPLMRVSGFTALAAAQTATFRYSAHLS